MFPVVNMELESYPVEQEITGFLVKTIVATSDKRRNEWCQVSPQRTIMLEATLRLGYNTLEQ